MKKDTLRRRAPAPPAISSGTGSRSTTTRETLPAVGASGALAETVAPDVGFAASTIRTASNIAEDSQRARLVNQNTFVAVHTGQGTQLTSGLPRVFESVCGSIWRASHS